MIVSTHSSTEYHLKTAIIYHIRSAHSEVTETAHVWYPTRLFYGPCCSFYEPILGKIFSRQSDIKFHFYVYNTQLFVHKYVSQKMQLLLVLLKLKIFRLFKNG